MSRLQPELSPPLVLSAKDLCLKSLSFLIFLVLIFLAIGSQTIPAESQQSQRTMRRRGTPDFVAETAALMVGDSLKAFTYVEVPVNRLFFAPRPSGGLEAVLDITVQIYDGNFQVAGDVWRHRISAESIRKVRNSTRALRKTIRFPITPGDYKVSIEVSQPEAGTRNEKLIPLKVIRSLEKGLEVGKILFGICSSNGDDFQPLVEAPVLGRKFGGLRFPTCFYTQVFHSKKSTTRAAGKSAEVPTDDSLHVEWTLDTHAGQELRRGKQSFMPGSGVTSIVMPLFLEKLWMGSYLLTVRCRLGGKEKAVNAHFELDESRVSLGAGFDSAIDMIEVIADEDELKKLRETQPEDRQEAWDEFWKNRDPEPETDRNEFKEEFFTRIRYANEHYGVLEPGWRSDRGRIYIKYGAPDTIESFPQNQDRRPYEIWDYYRFRLRYVFVDYEGFGRYVLQQPGRF